MANDIRARLDRTSEIIPIVEEASSKLLDEYKRLIMEKERATIEGRFSDIRFLADKILQFSKELKDRGIL